MEKTVNFIREEITQHMETIDYDDPRDFIDSFLVQRKNHPNDEAYNGNLY